MIYFIRSNDFTQEHESLNFFMGKKLATKQEVTKLFISGVTKIKIFTGLVLHQNPFSA